MPAGGGAGSASGGGASRGGGGGGREGAGGGCGDGRSAVASVLAPTLPSRHAVVAVKQTAADEPTSAFPVTAPVQVKALPPAPVDGGQATAWMPASVLSTATGGMPAP